MTTNLSYITLTTMMLDKNDVVNFSSLLNPYMSSYVGMAIWKGGSCENTPEGSTETHKSFFPHINK